MRSEIVKLLEVLVPLLGGSILCCLLISSHWIAAAVTGFLVGLVSAFVMLRRIDVEKNSADERRQGRDLCYGVAAVTVFLAVGLGWNLQDVIPVRPSLASAICFGIGYMGAVALNFLYFGFQLVVRV